MKILIDVWTVIGAWVFVIVVWCIIRDVIIEKIKEIMRRQNKIRFLCQHEYVPKWERQWYADKYSEYELECRKCGHKKKICFYEEKENAN